MAARCAWANPHALRARCAGYTVWRGVTASRGHLADEAGETWGRGARFGIVPLPDERVYWFATLSTPPDSFFDDEHDFLQAAGTGGAGLGAALVTYDGIRRRRTHALWRSSRLTGTVAQYAGPLRASPP